MFTLTLFRFRRCATYVGVIMAMRLVICVCALILLLVSAAAAQCPSPQRDSPVAAPTLDTIPPGSGLILTYSPTPGTLVQGRANGRFALAQINANEQKVWFGVDWSVFGV